MSPKLSQMDKNCQLKIVSQNKHKNLQLSMFGTLREI